MHLDLTMSQSHLIFNRQILIRHSEVNAKQYDSLKGYLIVKCSIAIVCHSLRKLSRDPNSRKDDSYKKRHSCLEIR